MQLQCAHSAKARDEDIYKKEKKKIKNRIFKKKVSTVATVPLGTVATVQNLKKRKKKTKGLTKMKRNMNSEKGSMSSAKIL